MRHHCFAIVRKKLWFLLVHCFWAKIKYCRDVEGTRCPEFHRHEYCFWAQSVDRTFNYWQKCNEFCFWIQLLPWFLVLLKIKKCPNSVGLNIGSGRKCKNYLVIWAGLPWFVVCMALYGGQLSVIGLPFFCDVLGG